jgi:hypothetical protein
MYCFNNFYNRHILFCVLQFIGSTASTISLCMSAYGLAKYNDDNEWKVEQRMVVACLTTTIIVHSIKDALIANPQVLKNPPASTKIENIEIE